MNEVRGSSQDVMYKIIWEVLCMPTGKLYCEVVGLIQAFPMTVGQLR